MHVTEKAFREPFEKRGLRTPPLLLEALKFANGLDHERYSGGFMFVPPYAVMPDGITGNEEFLAFGEEPEGSMYAFWRTDGRELEDSPVVYINSEGVGHAVVAEDLRAFFELLALGTRDLGRSCGDLDFRPETPSAKCLPQFRAWLAKKYGITAPSDPVAIVELAQSKNPGLEEAIQRPVGASASSSEKKATPKKKATKKTAGRKTPTKPKRKQ
jgi:hypothetical protein